MKRLVFVFILIAVLGFITSTRNNVVGKIISVSSRNSTNDGYTMNSDQSDMLELLNIRCLDAAPDWDHRTMNLVANAATAHGKDNLSNDTSVSTPSLEKSASPFATPAHGEPAPDIRAWLWTTTGCKTGLAPIQAAAERAGCETVCLATDELVFRFSGMSNNYAYVRSNGEIVIGTTRDITKLEDVDNLNADLLRAYAFVEQVSPTIPDTIKHGCLYYNLAFYLPSPGIYKRVVFPPGLYDGILNVPQCEVKDARIAIFPAPDFFGALFFRDHKYYDRTSDEPGRKTFNVAKELVFGSHQFKIGPPGLWRLHPRLIVTVEAITTPTPEKIYFTGNGMERVIVTRMLPLPSTTKIEETQP